MSTWLFDIGNSRLKCAPLHHGCAGAVVAIAHDGKRFAPSWADALPSDCSRACVASVASTPLLDALRTELVARGAAFEQAMTLREFDGVRIAYADPGQLGVDRFLALLAAHAQCPGAALVVGVGTALTIDLLAGDGHHQGGRIAPSPVLMREALHARASQLPAAGGEYTEFAAATNDALASGCEGAAIALVQHSLEEAGAQLGAAPILMVHGGGAGALLPRLPDALHAPALVLDGLARWAARPR